MNTTKYTIWSNPLVDTIFGALKTINIGIITIGLILVAGWYVVTYTNNSNTIEQLSENYGIHTHNAMYLIETKCSNVLVNPKTLDIVKARDGFGGKDATGCLELSKINIESLVAAHTNHTRYFSTTESKAAYLVIFIIILSYCGMLFVPVLIQNPLSSAIVISAVWLTISIAIFPLTFGSERIHYTTYFNISSVTVSTVITNDDNTKYVQAPLSKFGKVMYLPSDTTPSTF